MRLRGKPWATTELAQNEQNIHDPKFWKGQWQKRFGNQNPIYLEIGCGKGRFSVQSALLNPHINFIAVERSHKIIAMALRHSKENGLPKNLVFVHCEAALLEEYFEENELARVYINFCDPWRNRQKWHKRRLTHQNYVCVYKKLMGGGQIHFKTDNVELFTFSLQQFQEQGYQLRNLTYDLHGVKYNESENATQNIMTEYEMLFFEKKHPICRVEAHY